MRSLGQRPVTGSDEDPRVAGLRVAVARLRRELAALRTDFPDRAIAEDELATLAAMASGGVPETARLRGSLLLIAGALGSMSALARPLREVREAVDLFGGTRARGLGAADPMGAGTRASGHHAPALAEPRPDPPSQAPAEPSNT